MFATLNNLRQHETDTGSSECQITKLHFVIQHLTKNHFQKHQHDFDVKRSIVKKVSRLNKHKAYLKRRNPAKYQEVIRALGMRK